MQPGFRLSDLRVRWSPRRLRYRGAGPQRHRTPGPQRHRTPGPQRHRTPGPQRHRTPGPQRHRTASQIVGAWPGLLAVALGAPAVTLSLIAATADAAGTYEPRTFYVARWGSDLSSATDPQRPWRSVYHVNKATLRPGDRVLFRGGETFSDAALMPGAAGTWVSGTSTASVTFSSYGGGLARLQKGIYFASSRRLPYGPSVLAFRNLALGPDAGFEGTGSWITLTGLRISNTLDATVLQNRITRFRDNGVSVRYRNANIAGNYIARGSIGIAWFQYDTLQGRSRFVGNSIWHTSSAAIFVCGVLEGCAQPIESFVISGNRLLDTQGDVLNLQPTLGTYKVLRNFGER